MPRTPIPVYLAARYSRRDELNGYRAELEGSGLYTVTSRWLDGGHQIDDAGLSAEASRAERERFAREDLDDLYAASVVVSFTEPPRSTSSRGGRHVEFGMGLAFQKTSVVVGPAENVFHCLPSVERFDTWPAALDYLLTERSKFPC